MGQTFRPVKARTISDPDGFWMAPGGVVYPQAVQQNGLVFTGGQRALDESGRILRPHDLLGQVDLVIARLGDILRPIGASRRHLVRAVAYYINNGSIEETEFRDYLGEALGTPGTVTIVPVPVPHFYFDGLMVEIDFMLSEGFSEPVKSDRRSRPFADAVTADDLVYISQVTAETVSADTDDLMAQLASIRGRLEVLLDEADGGLDDIIKLTTYYTGSAYDWARIADARCGWFNASFPVITDVGLSRLGPAGAKVAIDAVAVRRASPNHWRRRPVTVSGLGRWPIDLPHPQAIRMGDLLVTGGQLAISESNAVQAPYELDTQAPVVMNHLGYLLEEAGLSFHDVVKATTYYRSGPGAEDLHEILAAGSRYFVGTGPASTAMTVTGLPAAAAMISVEVTAVK